jgi:hypothetical protein
VKNRLQTRVPREAAFGQRVECFVRRCAISQADGRFGSERHLRFQHLRDFLCTRPNFGNGRAPFIGCHAFADDAAQHRAKRDDGRCNEPRNKAAH